MPRPTPHPIRSWHAAALCLSSCLAVAGCGQSGPEPSSADIRAYLATSQPAYLHVTKVDSSFTAMSTLGSKTLPDGSWRVHVTFLLEAQEDLLAPAPGTAARRAAFDRTVASMEEFRVARIDAVAQLGRQLGLVAPGATTPEPAVAIRVATRKGQSVSDQVDLLAEPDGKGWRFFQLDAQSVDDDATGAPPDVLRAQGSRTVFVLAGSEEERARLAREKRFLDIVSHAPKP